MSDLTKLEEKLSTDKTGVLVQASTLGALEALESCGLERLGTVER